MDHGIFERRRETLRRRLAERDIPALLVTSAANRWYLTGFELSDSQCNETAGWLLVTARSGDHLMTDPRFEEAARRVFSGELLIYSARKFETIGPYLAGLGLGSVAFDPRHLSVRDFDRLRVHLPLRPVEELVEELRIIKDPREVELLEASCALNHKVLEAVEGRLGPGLTEAQAAWEVERLFREGGAEGLAFPTIVGAGVNAALPHAEPGPSTLPDEGLVLVDCGGRLDGYCSDQTRTFWIGAKPSDRFRRVRDLVRAAQDKALAFIRPGEPIAESYNLVRRLFEDQGLAERFTHGLGHGIGLETHEAPSLSSVASGEFRPGMVVTVEPGLYWPDWGGVRWEYMVVVTEDGCRVL